jgi:hypothetical protein
MAMFGILSQNRGESDTLYSQFGDYDSAQLLRLAMVNGVMGASLGTSGEGHQISVAFPLVRIEPAVRYAQAITRWG